MDVTFSIDWIHVTEQYETYALPSSFVCQPMGLKITPATPRYGYTAGWVNAYGAHIMRNMNRPDMGVHVSYSAATLNKYREAGVDALEILRWHVDRFAVVTRLDLAFDMRNSQLSIDSLKAELTGGEATMTAKTWNHIQGSDGGQTLYIGSRSSETFLRIYDKGIESKQGGDWVRVEIELKGSKSEYAAHTMVTEPKVSAYRWAQSWLKGYVSFKHPVMTALCNEPGIRMEKANKPDKDTERWLLEQVAPAMARYMAKTSDYNLLVRFMAILAAYDRCDTT